MGSSGNLPTVRLEPGEYTRSGPSRQGRGSEGPFSGLNGRSAGRDLRTQTGFSPEHGERWVDDVLEQLSEVAGR